MTRVQTEEIPTEADTEITQEVRVLIAEVQVVGVDAQPDLRNQVYRVIQTRPGRTDNAIAITR